MIELRRRGDEPEAVLFVEGVALSAACALDVGVGAECWQAATRTRQLLTTTHRAHRVLPTRHDVSRLHMTFMTVHNS